ncbi:isopeptide-forming domain-containing fimbrial protein [Paenibacillus sp. MMS20-IR301]|uniref:beta strand repeat-containing protein n=1 Tax=Paenibacillus sp. MMS20-IR301 TaxID=2895946 RepID=UPI0028E75B17|nr:isopeptide-forming domain-containing fimbrial protein [Paenibacillus sp. MMS20-IR301]WNS46474.1 isopeptide-forming domain-containing fimbrial protein [Paenibacillus sp. MMS20-IR301]
MKIIPLVVRSTINATGAITFTGNTLGLSRSDVIGVPGTQDSIGAFSTINTASVFGTYPAGTTSLYQSNSSAAILVLPAGSTVLYAELIWGGSYINGSVNLSAVINNPVSFTTPLGNTVSVSPDAATANTVDLGGGAAAYVRSANVTSIIQASGAGTYVTAGVVGTIVIAGDSTANHAGWTLGVIYSNPSLPFRNMSLRAGAVLVQSTSAPVVTTITGFATPVTGALGGRILFSAQEGDANRSGDQALFGPTSATQVALSGPNNFANNFFASQINNDTGNLNTTGTFGSRNQTNGSPGSNITGGRQGWDITNVDVSARLVNNQSSALLTLTTSGDAYVVNGNGLQIDINAPKIALTKSASATGTVVGDTITYTVTVNNSGTASAASVVLSDTLPAGLTFIAGSVVVAGASRPTYDITAGIPLGSLALGTSITITYQARVTSLPNPQFVPNTATAAFTFQSVAGGPIVSGVIPSNTSTIPVYSPVLGIVKSANTTNATVGDQILYTLQISNTGNISATTTLTDNIPAGSTYVAGSFTVNGTPVAGNPAAGIPIGTIAAGGSSTVQFRVLVNSLPSPPQLVDQATAAYTFLVPDGRTLSGSAASNTLTLPVRLPNVAIVKSASFPDVAVGDTLTYTSVVTNNGIVAVTTVVLSDPIPAGSTFVTGSVTVAGTARPAADPASGITIGTVAPGSSAAVTFQVNVTSIPASGQLSNQSSASYSSGAFNAITQSNTTLTPVYQPVIGIVKSASPSSATVGGNVQYTLVVRNTGNLAATVTITDNIPAGTAFIAGSVTVNGVARPSDSPVSGIPLGSVAAGATFTVTFLAAVQSLPSPATLTDQGSASYTYQLPSGRSLAGGSVSNTVTIPVSAPNITLLKSASLTAVAVGEYLTYTIAVSNPSGVAVNNVVLSDPAPAGSTFVAGTVTVNGTPLPSANPNAGISLGTIAAGAASTVVFQVNAVSVPSPPQLNNRASASFTAGAFSGTALSNTVLTPVFIPVINLVKSSSPAQASVGSLLSFSIQASNSGNIAATLNLTDNLPPQTVFETNSVTVGGTPLPGYSPLTGIPVGPLAPGDSVTVSFLVTVTALPPNQQLLNSAAASYSFTLPDGRVLGGNAGSNTLTVPVSAPNVSIVKSVNAIDAVTGDILTYTSVLTNNSITSVSNIILSDPLPENVAFIPGTVIVGGVSRPQAVPSAGIPIGSLAQGASVAVTFEVRITMPIPSQVNNQSTVSFTSGVFSGSSSSNITTTPVTQPQISLVKSANDLNATVGDTVIYTIVVSNSGNVAANVTLTDNIPAGTSFDPNSVIVGGFPQPGAAPDTGIAVGVVAPGASISVSFTVFIVSLPSPQQLVNQASSTYTFTPPDGRLLSGSAASNTVTIAVSAPNVAVVKSTTSTSVALGDTIAYSVSITNNGMDPVNNVVLSDPTPGGASFVTGSVSVNGVPFPNANPATGVAVGTLASGASAVVSYSVTVTSVPADTSIDNQATVTYTSGVFAGSTFSNHVAVPVFQPNIAAAKSASTSNATVGDTVTYTLTVTNTGNYGANLTVTDNIPAGTTFVANSVLVNGLPLPQADPAAGIAAGTVAPGGTVAVSFSVVITSLPSPQLLVNQGTVAYSFTLPDGRTLGGSVLTNTLNIPVTNPNLGVVKSTATTATNVGDTITYSVALTNNGIATVNNVVFTDALPAGTAFVPGSVLVDGVARPVASPSTGVTIGSIAPGATVTVAFRVTVTSLPASGVLNNQSSVSFTSGALSSVAFSNIVTTPVYQPIVTAVKNSNTANATVGDTINYSVSVSNTGNYAAAATLTDTIPAGTTLVPNSVLINGFPSPGADPATGVPLGTIAAGATLTVMFSVVIVTLPASQQLSNQAIITFNYTLPDGRTFNQSANSNINQISVSSPNVLVAKSTTVIDAVVGDIVPYSINVTNSGIAPINNVVLSDPIPAGASFVAGSVTVDGTPVPGGSPANGIALGTIAPGASIVVTFNTRVNTLPNPATLSNQASVSFTSGAFSGASYSNTLVIPVYQPIIGILKSADTSNATVGDTVTYAFSVTNTGNLPANVILTDSIPAGGVFVPNSVLVNGQPVPGANPTTGINLGTVAAGATVVVTVTLQVTVASLPSPQQLVNQAAATFTFTPPDGRLLSGSAVSNTLVIPVSSPDVTAVKSTPSIDAVVGDLITYTIVVTNNGIVAVNNVVLVDPIPAGSQFVTGSVSVDGVFRPGANPATGVQIGTIAPGASSTVTFQVQVIAI